MRPRPRLLSACGFLLSLGIVGPLLALDWTQIPGGRRTALSAPLPGPPGFESMSAAQLGMTVTNVLSEERGLTNQIYLNGSGVAAGDVDGDGRVDLYFCGLDSPNTLWRNLGDWHFEDITAKAQVACSDQASTGTALVDIDGDGDLDLLVNGIRHGTRLFLNDGQGVFRETTQAAGLTSTAGSTSLALADIDGDGLLDLYVVNYRNDTLRDLLDQRFRVGVTNGISRLISVNGQSVDTPELAGRYTLDATGGVLENGTPGTLYRNTGAGTFVPVPWTQGAFLDERGKPVETPYDWGLSARFHDINGDGLPDLYVCNDFQSPDRIWLNQGRGIFQAIARTAIRQTSLFSMGVDFADLDRDGFDDLFVADMLSRDHSRRQVQVLGPTAFSQVRQSQDDRPQFSRNTVFRNRGNQTFAEIAYFSGLEASEWSWCPVFLDVDLDGFEDLLVTTGHWRDAQHADISRQLDEEGRQKRWTPPEQLRARRRLPRLDTPNVAFRNNTDLTFRDAGAEWGFDSTRISHGMALADLDQDGDLDVIVNCLNEAPLMLRNRSDRPRIAVRLKGLPPNTAGVGARITVETPGLPMQTHELTAAGRYLSSDEPLRTFAAGTSSNRLSISVHWRSGARSRVTNAPANCLYELDEPAVHVPDPQVPPDGGGTPARTISGTWFEDFSAHLNHLDIDEPYDDFGRQPLLPRKLSELGPGVAWFDFNSDGFDDLILGGGRGGRLTVFRNNTQGGFVPQKARALESTLTDDLTTVLAWQPTSTQALFLLAQASFESTISPILGLRQFSLATGESTEPLPPQTGSSGPMAMADCNGDGQMDLFLGNRTLPGRYPEAGPSILLLGDHGSWKTNSPVNLPLATNGPVSAAIFSDLESDGFPELVTVGDWGSVQIFRNRRGELARWDPPLQSPVTPPHSDSHSALPGTSRVLLSHWKGWWNSVAAGDFDNDGRMDLVVGNWGRNHGRQRYTEAGKDFRVHFGDALGNGSGSLLESQFDPLLKRYVPARDWASLGESFPSLRDRYPGFTAFSQADTAQLLATGMPELRTASVNCFDSVLLLNRGDAFEFRPLPTEAQLAPVFGLAVGDFDGDGNEDVFLAQNVYGVNPAESRLDAGCGLLLKGDGRGNLQAVPAGDGGIALHGEGRAAAVSDFDHDGRLDLVVTQHRGPTRLFHNQKATPGLRVQISGLAGNFQGIGTRIRARRAGQPYGPTHEVHLGSGYWSQDSNTLLLTGPQSCDEIEVLWPEGLREVVPVPSGARQISLKQTPTDGP